MGKARLEGKKPVGKTERILVTVKTYPTLSSKYGELVCTAGVREDGSWVRIYPIPFRRLADYQQFEKYTWIEAELATRRDDTRPETRSPATDWHEIQKGEHIGTGASREWEERKSIILHKCTVYDDFTVLIEKAKRNELSLAVFKPTKISDFVWRPVPCEWSKRKLARATRAVKQGNLFYQDEFLKEVHVMPKLPYEFKYVFCDKTGKQRRLMIEDWEVGQLYWNCLKKYSCEKQALQKVREKYFDDFALTKDLHFFVGTLARYHSWALNPFVIIGTFHPPKTKQMNFGF